MQAQHEPYMQQCLSLARRALETGNPPVGAIIVHEGTVIGMGIESGRSSGDITNHAEILAIRDAIEKGYTSELKQACLYTTHEPCIMCAYVIRHHHIPELVYGISVPYVGGFTSPFQVLSTDHVPKWGAGPAITEEVCREACIALNKEFEDMLKNI